MVPSIFMLLLCLIPAIMSAIAVVREKETGSIANFRSTPITRFEYLIGKELPYIAVAMIAFFALFLIAIFIFRVPPKGPFLVLLLGTFVYVIATVGFGVLISSFTRTQVAAVFATAILSIVPAVNFSGMLAPVSSLSGGARVIGLSFPSSWYQQISVGVFAKALGIADLWRDIAAIALIALVFLALSLLCFASRRREMSEAASPKAPHLVEAKPLTFVDHVVNIFHLVIKELRSIRADPVMLLLVVYSFSISVNTVATGAVTEATNLSVGIVDEDGSDLSRRIAEGLRLPTFQPPVQHHRFRDRPDDGSGQAPVRRRDPAQFRGRRSRPAQDRHPDQCRRDRGRPGRQRRQLSAERHRHRDPAVHFRDGRTRAARRSIWWCAPPSTRTSRRRGSRR